MDDGYKLFFENAVDAMFISSPDGRFVEINEAGLELFRVTRDRIGEMVVSDIYAHPDDRLVARASIEREGIHRNYPIRMRRSDGSTFHALVSATVQRDEDGNTIGFMGVIRDVDELARVEDEHKLMRFLVDNASECLFATTRDGTIVLVNDTACRRLEYDRLELEGMRAYELIPGFTEAKWNAHWESLEQNEALLNETEYLTRSGRLIPVEVSETLVKSGDTELCCSFARDITDRRRQARQRAVMHRELDHRVKNNLASIMSLARMSANATDSLSEFLRLFEARVQAISIAHEMLERTREKAADVRAIAELIARPFSQLHEDRVAIDGDPVTVPARVTPALCLMLHELLSNACRKGALASDGTVAVSWRHENETLTLYWVEAGAAGPGSLGPSEDLITGLISRDLRGAMHLEPRSDGMLCRIEITLDGADAPNRAAAPNEAVAAEH